MASLWRINRTLGQIHATSFVSEQKLHADKRGEQQGIAQSDASIGLSELQAPALMRLLQAKGHWREHFPSPGKLWKILYVVVAERLREVLASIISVPHKPTSATTTRAANAFAQPKMREMCDLAHLANTGFDDLQRLLTISKTQLMTMGAKVHRSLTEKNAGWTRQ